MSKELKPLPEYISDKMIAAIKDGKSIFEKPMNANGTSQFVQPFNASTGSKYNSSTALILMMQNKDDPRWMTYDQARFNKTPVTKDSKATYFNFFSKNVTRPVIENGEPVKKENGYPKTERVTLDKPVLVDVTVFNGSQLQDMPQYQPEPQLLTPIERAQAIVDAGNAAFKADESLIRYSPHTDAFMKEKEEFPSPELYYATALHELAHWASHDSRFNKQADEPDADNLIKEELRTNIASILISAELNLPYDPGEHAKRLDAFAQLMKDDSKELFKAAADAQKIADFVLDLEPKIEMNQEISASKSNPNNLEKGDVINYNGSQYTVLEKLKNKVFEMQKDEEKFKLSSKNGLYTSLLEAKKNPQELDRSVTEEQNMEQEEEQEHALAEEETSGYKIKR
jgi:antirestriction protein ArdC